MTTVFPKPNESIDSLLKRFKKAVDSAGILADLRKHEFFEKPSVKKRREKSASKKRAIKAAKKQEKYAKGKNRNFKWNRDRTKQIPIVVPPIQNKKNIRRK